MERTILNIVNVRRLYTDVIINKTNKSRIHRMYEVTMTLVRIDPGLHLFRSFRKVKKNVLTNVYYTYPFTPKHIVFINIL